MELLHILWTLVEKLLKNTASTPTSVVGRTSHLMRREELILHLCANQDFTTSNVRHLFQSVVTLLCFCTCKTPFRVTRFSCSVRCCCSAPRVLCGRFIVIAARSPSVLFRLSQSVWEWAGSSMRFGLSSLSLVACPLRLSPASRDAHQSQESLPGFLKSMDEFPTFFEVLLGDS